jgi:hypothetical protein
MGIPDRKAPERVRVPGNRIYSLGVSAITPTEDQRWKLRHKSEFCSYALNLGLARVRYGVSPLPIIRLNPYNRNVRFLENLPMNKEIQPAKKPELKVCAELKARQGQRTEPQNQDNTKQFQCDNNVCSLTNWKPRKAA